MWTGKIIDRFLNEDFMLCEHKPHVLDTRDVSCAQPIELQFVLLISQPKINISVNGYGFKRK